MKKWGNKVVKIMKIDEENFTLKLKFSDNSIQYVSLNHIFSKPRGLAAEILRGNLFKKCYILEGAIAWPNGFELCPDAIRQWTLNSSSTRTRAA